MHKKFQGSVSSLQNKQAQKTENSEEETSLHLTVKILSLSIGYK